MTKMDYPQMARDINAVGLDNLRRHIRKFHPRTVPHMERNIAIIKYCVIHGPSETGRVYGIHPTSVRRIIEFYWDLAKEAQYEAERLREKA